MRTDYVIEYYDRVLKKRVKYLNNTCFKSWHAADAEIARIKKHDRTPNMRLFNGCIRCTRFKIIPYTSKT